jgi:hypothetical protein
MKEQALTLTVILGVILFLALLFLIPFAIIWSLNTLFPLLAIPYTIETWLATFFLGAVFNSAMTIKAK